MNLAPDIRQAYYTLDLMPGATWAEVKAAYRRLARALHPDLNPGRQGADMARVNQAYQRLSDFLASQPQPAAADGYRAYDFENWAPRRGQRPFHYESFQSPPPRREPRPEPQPSPATRPAPRPATTPAAGPAPLAPLAPVDPPVMSAFTAPLAEDFAYSAYSAPAAPRPRDAWRLRGLRRQGVDLVYQVEVSGHPRRIELPMRDRRPCAACQGTGRQDGRRNRGACPLCAGRGQVTSSRLVGLDLPAHFTPGQVLSLASHDLPQGVLVELLPTGGEV